MLRIPKVVRVIMLVLLALFFTEGVTTHAFPVLATPWGFSYRLIWVTLLSLFSWSVLRRKTVNMPMSTLFLGLVVSISILSSIFNLNLERPLITLTQLVLTFAFFINIIIFSNTNFSDEDLRKFVIFSAIGATITAAVGLVEFVLPSFVKGILGTKVGLENSMSVQRGSLVASQSVFEHPGLFGWFMSFSFCVCFSMAIVDKSKVKVILSIVFFLALVVSLRRKAIMASTIVAMLAVYLNYEQSRKKILMLTLMLSLLCGMYFIFKSEVDYLVEDVVLHYVLEAGEGVAPRVFLSKTSIEIAKDYFPLGAGLGMYGSWMSRLYYSPLYYEYGVHYRYGLGPDNPIFLNDTFWPMLFGEIGFLGTFMYFVLLLNIFFKLIFEFKRSKTPFNKGFLLAAAMALFEGLIESLATPVFSKMPISLFISFFIGVAFYLANKEQKEAKLASGNYR